MKILHTADIHLRDYGDARWQALQQIIELGASERIDVLVISGDLFDSDAGAGELRPRIRALFDDRDFRVLMIPGNHDAGAYDDGQFLGETVTVLNDLLSPVQIDDTLFWGFPYDELADEEILEYLSIAGEKAKPGLTHVLLFHGELYDVMGGWAHYGEEGRQRYLPVKLSYFQRLPWQYILAGHFHTHFEIYEIKKEQYFVYPGSPVSITRRETGRRKINLFVLGERPRPVELDTFFYEKVRISLDPFQKFTPMQIIAEHCAELPANAGLLLEINGYINSKQLGMNETELHKALQKTVAAKGEIVKVEFRDIHEILEDELFQAFKERLESRVSDPAERQRVLDLALRAMMAAG